jgi:hypothetical protein
MKNEATWYVNRLHQGTGILPLLTIVHSHASDLTGCHMAVLLQYD